MIGRERLLTPEEAEEAGYFRPRDISAEMRLSLQRTNAILYELHAAGSIERVKVSGRGGQFYYRAATKNQ